jgi:hypothetical protein
LNARFLFQLRRVFFKALFLHDQKYQKPNEWRVGYMLLWLLGVPASVLFVIFLLRGCT